MLITPEYVFKDVTHITPEFLAGKGIRALVLDIDNTLTADRSQELPDEVAGWLDHMRLRLFEDNTLEIQVKDWGVGIADVEQARQPLYTTGTEERSGMGFTIMESFMDAVKVRSTPGKGTVVTLRRRVSRRMGAPV